MRSAQGDFHHWVALFNHFDALFDELVKPRADLALRYDQAEAKADPPFPSSTVVAVLRVTATILENCSNKHLYHSYDVRPTLRPAYAWPACRASLTFPVCGGST